MEQSKVLARLKRAIDEKLFTAAAIIISLCDHVIFEAYVGYEEEKGEVLTGDHLFDLASLTKPIVVATGFMKLCSGGLLDLDEPLRHFFPRLWIHPDLAGVPLWAILSHAGGWKNYEPFYLKLSSPENRDLRKETLLKTLLETPPAYRPLTDSIYSDLGYMVAGFILEELTGISLDLFWEKLATDLSVNPDGIHFMRNVFKKRVVSTGWCPWRKRWLKGEVHDENCYAMGGVSGHAGLFGTARAVRDWLSGLFFTWKGSESQAGISRDVIKHFWERRREIPHSTWVLGFDTPSANNSTSGRFFSSRSIGHLGFTGTSFWLDLSDGFSVVLLTNRVYYPGTKEKMREFRREIHDLARMEYGRC